jgi:hypothetical protein
LVADFRRYDDISWTQGRIECAGDASHDDRARIEALERWQPSIDPLATHTSSDQGRGRERTG